MDIYAVVAALVEDGIFDSDFPAAVCQMDSVGGCGNHFGFGIGGDCDFLGVDIFAVAGENPHARVRCNRDVRKRYVARVRRDNRGRRVDLVAQHNRRALVERNRGVCERHAQSPRIYRLGELPEFRLVDVGVGREDSFYRVERRDCLDVSLLGDGRLEERAVESRRRLVDFVDFRERVGGGCLLDFKTVNADVLAARDGDICTLGVRR